MIAPDVESVDRREPWKLLPLIVIGVTVGMPGLALYTLGPLVKALQSDFGWSRPAIQGALLLSTGVGALAGPFAGRLADRWGVGLIAGGSLLLLSASFAACVFVRADIRLLYGCYGAMGLAGAGASPVVWTLAVNHRFSAHRGLALGVALSGTGLCAAIGPKLAAWAVAHQGWRAAYLVLAAVPLLTALPIALMLRRGRRTRSSSVLARAMTVTAGPSLISAMRNRRMWLLAASAFGVYAGGIGVISNLVPFLSDHGLSTKHATDALLVLGVASIVSRLLTGPLLDRFWAPAIGLALTWIPAGVLLALTLGAVAPTTALFVAGALGLVAGAELDLVSYLTARYFGTASYGRIYGVIYAVLAIAGGLAPLTFASLRGLAPIYLASGLLFGAGGLLLCLGRYPRGETLEIAA